MLRFHPTLLCSTVMSIEETAVCLFLIKSSSLGAYSILSFNISLIYSGRVFRMARGFGKRSIARRRRCVQEATEPSDCQQTHAWLKRIGIHAEPTQHETKCAKPHNKQPKN